MKLFNKVILLTCISLIFLSCEKPEQLGPDLKGLYGPVNVTETLTKSDASPDFSIGEKVYFSAAFENDAIWTLTIVGQTSGAVKTITGISDRLGAFNATWDGSADAAPSFQAENVTITLSFQNSSTTLTESLAIAGTKNLDAGGVLVANFNSVPGGKLVQFYTGNETYNNTNWISDYPVTVFNNTTYGYPDGGAYLFMGDKQPTNNNVNSPGNTDPYVDFIKMWPQGSGYGEYFPLYADPKKVYFNIMVANTGTQYTWLRIILEEEGKEARYIDIKPDWSGWKLLSFNYTDFVSDAKGNKEPFNPQKISAINFLLLSEAPQAVLNARNASDKVSVAFDHVIFTHNKPYQP